MASLVAVTGRRRIGKSRLLQEYAKSFERSFVFQGLAPTRGVKPADQQAEFARLLRRYFKWPSFNANGWGELFALLADQTREGSVLIVLDEISWMAQGDNLFLPQLKNAWDLEFKENPRLVLAVCGSVSSWIDKNILSSTGFVGRVSETMRLEELPLTAAAEFWGQQAERVSAYEKIKFLNVVGGVPRYLEELRPAESAEQNVLTLCFDPSGLLFSEFHRLFSDLFSRSFGEYTAIVEALASGHQDQQRLVSLLNRAQGGTLSSRLQELQDLSFIRRDHTWDLDTRKESKLSRYRVSDNYSRFYLKYIAPHRKRIEADTFPDTGLQFIPGWETIMGLQFENLVLANRGAIFHALGLDRRDVRADGPFFQTKTASRPGVQIDYLIQSRFNTLYLCELKCHADPVPSSIQRDVQRKLDRLRRPKNFSVRPVLISAGEVSPTLRESRFFDRIVLGEQLLLPLSREVY